MEWTNIKGNTTLLGQFVDVVLEVIPSGEQANAESIAMGSYVIFAMLMEQVFDVFSKTASVHAATPIVPTSAVFTKTSSPGAVAEHSREMATIYLGVMLHRLSKKYQKRDDQQMLTLLDTLSAHVQELPPGHRTPFLSRWSRGGLRFPQPGLLDFGIQVIDGITFSEFLHQCSKF
jgi:hypothetical protein